MKKVSIVILCAIGLGMMNAQQQTQQSYELGVVNAKSVKHKRSTREMPMKFNILGKWKVTEVSGKIYVKINPNAPEVEAPTTLFLGKNFIFDALTVTVKDGDKELKKSKYTFVNDYHALSIPEYSGVNTIDFSLSRKLLTFSQTPDACYAILAKQMNKTVEQIKAQFRIPETVVLNLKKQ